MGGKSRRISSQNNKRSSREKRQTLSMVIASGHWLIVFVDIVASTQILLTLIIETKKNKGNMFIAHLLAATAEDVDEEVEAAAGD